MNEKIEQLKKEALEFEAKYYSAGYIAGRSDGTIETARECARIAAVHSEEGVEFNGGDAIREHFGVEE